ncbi:MAG: PEP-CTERM sorting domain-containing protein [Sedimentisphaerales bacterium]
MKKYIVFAALISVFFAVPVRAQYVESMGLGTLQTVAINANYDGSGTIVWSGGQNGWLATDDYSGFVYFSQLPYFHSVTATATFTGMTDTSSGGQASASFSSGNWSITINATGSGDVLTLAGHILENHTYNEKEIDSTNKLDGRAVVVVDTAAFDDAYWENTDVGVLSLNDNIAGMIANISLPTALDFNSYAQAYASNNVTVTIYADESIVPEPATMALLALGGLLLRKRS